MLNCRNVLIVLLFLASAFLIQGCGGGGGDSSHVTSTGSISGTVYAPDGTTPVAGAIVYIPRGRAIEPPERSFAWTVSDIDGSFLLENVPAGNNIVKIIKDAWIQSFELTVPADQSVEAPKAVTTFADDLDAPPGSPFPGSNGDLDEPPAPPNNSGPIDEPPPPPV